MKAWKRLFYGLMHVYLVPVQQEDHPRYRKEVAPRMSRGQLFRSRCQFAARTYEKTRPPKPTYTNKWAEITLLFLRKRAYVYSSFLKVVLPSSRIPERPKCWQFSCSSMFHHTKLPTGFMINLKFRNG